MGWKLEFAAENSWSTTTHVAFTRTTVGVQLPAAGTMSFPTARRIFRHERSTMVAHLGRTIRIDEPAGRLDLFTEEELGTAIWFSISSIYDGNAPEWKHWLSFRPPGPERRTSSAATS